MGMKARANVATFFKYFVLIFMGFIMVYPLLWMVGSTFKTNAEIFTSLSPFTAHPTLDGYYNAVTKTYGGDITIWRAFLNTYSYVIPKVVFTVISSVIAAYGFSRFKFKGRDFLFGVMIMTLFLPQVTLVNVPQYMMYNKFDWINNPCTLPCGCRPCLLMRLLPYQLVQFIASRTIWDEAAIDGCGPARLRSRTRSSAPCSVPLVACARSSSWSCNDFMGPCFTLLPRANTPMAPFVKLSMDSTSEGIQWNRILALSLISLSRRCCWFSLPLRILLTHKRWQCKGAI